MSEVTNYSSDLGHLPCNQLSGVGPRMAEKLAQLNIHSVQDILFHLPFRYQDRTRVFPIIDVRPEEHVVVEGELISVSFPKVGRTRALCKIEDGTGSITLRFFHANPAQRSQFQVGVRLRCFGEVRRGLKALELVHPEYRIIDNEFTMPVEETLTPIYPSTEGMSQNMWIKLTGQALNLVSKGSALTEILPATILESHNFPKLADALHFVHRPPSDVSVDVLSERTHIAQKRLMFEELLAHRLSLLKLKDNFQIHATWQMEKSAEVLIEKFLGNLAFQLTNAQQKVLTDIKLDFAKPHPMLRLVQGDVGSGKTVVAAISILYAIANGYQGAVLAPTELLAEQHFATFKNWLQPLGVEVVLLTSQLKAKEKREILEKISNGTAQVVLGTHAIFQKAVVFHQLALIVVDEQHRFGVEQRSSLREKGKVDNKYPHQLIMTATPIPRTLAMSVYADLDYSVIDELPPGRTPVITTVIPNTKRHEILSRVREACLHGRQTYWVCTLIDESEFLQCQAAENAAVELSAVFFDLKVGLLHGAMKAADKEKTMADFKAKRIQLLVATTVIEVGVDVPNASLMIVENAERLGLAQLHQLRGRVGRGSAASHCVLMYQTPLSRLAKERLAIMRETCDGFKIAERDLQLRGPGEVLGLKQSGEMSLRIADLVKDSDLLPMVEQSAEILQKKYPQKVAPLIARWLGVKEKYGHV